MNRAAPRRSNAFFYCPDCGGFRALGAADLARGEWFLRSHRCMTPNDDATDEELAAWARVMLAASADLYVDWSLFEGAS